MRLRHLIAAAMVLAVAATAAAVVQQRYSRVEIVTHVLEPERLEPTPDRQARLHVPEGFAVSVFARDLGHPRVLAVADDGSVYVTRREPGDILVLRDSDHDGRADQIRVAVRRPMLHGLTFDKRRAYFVGVTDVFAADLQADGTFAHVTRLVNDLPVAGQ